MSMTAKEPTAPTAFIFCAHCVEEAADLEWVKVDGRWYRLCADCRGLKFQIATERARDRRRRASGAPHGSAVWRMV